MRAGGFRRRIGVGEAVRGVLLARGEETMVELHRAYKELVKDAYAEEWARYKDERGKYHRGYRVVEGRRVYLTSPPKGMTYLSFARYINAFVALGLIEPVLIDSKRKTAPEEARLISDKLLDVLSPIQCIIA